MAAKKSAQETAKIVEDVKKKANEATKKAVEKAAKKTEKVAEVVVEKTADAVTKAAEVSEQASDAAKEVTGKAAAKAKEAKETVKKAAAKRTRKPVKKVALQYYGAEIDVDSLTDRAIAQFGATYPEIAVREVKIYLKPEDNAAYYVINDVYTGKVDF